MITTERYIQTLWDSILLNNTGTPGDLATAGYPFDTYDLAPLDDIYHHQIDKAQEFLDANHTADLFQVKCLLRELLPKELHDRIDQLHESRLLSTTININGGNNLIVPNAKQARQQFKRKR